MCTRVIVDASAFDVLKQESPETAGGQLRRWIGKGHGLVAYSTVGRAGRELKGSPHVLALFRSYRQSGQAVLIEGQQIDEERHLLRDVETESGYKDKPMLALAAASDARVIVTRDNNLMKDFKNTRFAPKTGYRRSVYPIDESARVRRGFLHRRRCSRRRST